MRAVVDLGELASALRMVDPLAGSRGGRPTLQVVAGEAGLEISSTNQEQQITARCGASALEPGATIVPGAPLLDFVREAPGPDIALVTATDTLAVVSGPAAIHLGIDPSGQWSAPEHLSGAASTWTDDTLRSLGRVVHAASRDAGRPVLRGVAFEAGWAVATDAYRLAAVEVPLLASVEAIVPRDAIATIAESGVKSCTARFADGKVTFESDRFCVTSTMIVGEYPAWRAALPANPKEHIEFDRTEAVAVLKRMTVMASREPLRALTFESHADGLVVRCVVPQVGTQEDHLLGTSSMGQVSFRHQYLLELVENSTTDRIVLRSEGPLGAAQHVEDGFVAMLQPIRA